MSRNRHGPELTDAELAAWLARWLPRPPAWKRYDQWHDEATWEAAGRHNEQAARQAELAAAEHRQEVPA